MKLWIAIVCAIVFTIGGCRDEAVLIEQFPFSVAVHSEDGEPVKGAGIESCAGNGIRSGRDGIARLTATGEEGDRCRISVRCPKGYLIEGEDGRDLVLKHIQIVPGARARLQTPGVDFICREQVKSHVLVIHTGGKAELKIRVRGTDAATTDEDGVAQLVVTGTPDEQVEVVIDTSGVPSLRPKTPARRFTLPATQRFLVFEQKFTEKKRAPKFRKPTSNTGPTRL